jgi:hypothetical protein
VIGRLALRTLLMHPVRTAVLAGGFGLGVAVMANLLGVAEVVLEQSQSPALVGGGDVLVTGAASRLTSGRYLLWGGLGAPAFADRVAAVSPTRRGSVFLVQDGTVTRLRARGGIPSLERALDDPETADVSAWVDAPGDEAWISPGAVDVLRSLDRFHAIPDVPARAGSWVEWLYFDGQAGSTRFYLTFLVGPVRENGRRAAGVRLQLERAGRVENYGETAEIDANEVLATAPELTIGRSRIRLDGDRYVVSFDLRRDDRADSSQGPTRTSGRADGTVHPPSRGERRSRSPSPVQALGPTRLQHLAQTGARPGCGSRVSLRYGSRQGPAGEPSRRPDRPARATGEGGSAYSECISGRGDETPPGHSLGHSRFDNRQTRRRVPLGLFEPDRRTGELPQRTWGAEAGLTGWVRGSAQAVSRRPGRQADAATQSRQPERLARATGEIVLTARRGHSLPPLSITGAGGWISGYVVPVMSGALEGTIRVGDETLPLAGGTGYHDHNWGFWEGVSWQWGQVQHDGLSILYGRVFPPADAADASRVPGFMMVLGPDGPLGQATRVTIDETIDPTLDRPSRIIVRGNSPSLELRLDIDVESAIRTPWRSGPLTSDVDFLQMRGRYRVSGKAGDRALDFVAPGAAETFRGR